MEGWDRLIGMIKTEYEREIQRLKAESSTASTALLQRLQALEKEVKFKTAIIKTDYTEDTEWLAKYGIEYDCGWQNAIDNLIAKVNRCNCRLKSRLSVAEEVAGAADRYLSLEQDSRHMSAVYQESKSAHEETAIARTLLEDKIDKYREQKGDKAL